MAAMNATHRPPESANQTRDRLIRDEMRFLLQRDEQRFGKQLRARLLEEGCNLPLSVAKPAFYREMIAALAALNALWRLDAACFQSSGEAFDVYLRNAVNQMTRANPSGPLAALAFATLRKRVQLALIASLQKYESEPGAFETIFDGVSRCLQNIESDPTLFSRVMAFFFERTPYADHLATQTFWRTPQALDNEPV
jgi:hypothetical protein